MYKAGDKFTYLRGGSTSLYPSYHFSPNTYFTPLPINTNVHSIGFQFEYEPACPRCDPDMTKYGNEIFTVGTRQICYTGSTLTQIYDLFCPSNDGVVIFWTDANGRLLNSTAGYQPAGKFFSIDSVIDYHNESPSNSLLAFDKIISGRFTCRVFDPENKAYYKDFTGGSFRIPIWRNKLE